MLIGVIALRGIMRQSGESVKGETTVIANAVCRTRALKAHKSHHSIVERSFDAGEFPTSSDKGIVSLNCKSGVLIYFRPSCFAKFLSFLKKKNYGGRCTNTEHL